MPSIINKTSLAVGLILLINGPLFADELDKEYAEYCKVKGGKVETMEMVYHTMKGDQKGNSNTFCTFMIHKGFIAVGLQTFASNKPSIAATYIKLMPEVEKDSPLWKGPYTNPSANFCKNIGGSNVGFNMSGGGYQNDIGESDICVFGDNSMVSGWSLIYIANGRQGYDVVRASINSAPLSIPIPK